MGVVIANLQFNSYCSQSSSLVGVVEILRDITEQWQTTKNS